ncbi:trypsin-like serine protease [Natrarchaeobius sp. A-rgal3]|uniref:trypsin-like serine protease n=1 Tax=Natrarchaeobius versutus TaxID=1679078 RepID=UPI00350F1BD0
MPSTRDYEYLLECENVIGVDYDEDDHRVTVFVSQKRPRSVLGDADDVETRLTDAGDDVAVRVVDVGYGETKEGFDALSILEPVPEAAHGRQERHRPIPAGVSEINANSTAGTGGPYPARVAEAAGANGAWADDVEPGDLVRLSNNHVYARSDAADFGEAIRQPSPEDSGGPDDEVGELVGYVPIEDGALVDVAARSVDREQESESYYELEESWPTGVRREGYDDLRGETVTKTGRTTAVTSAEVEATSASVRVDFGERGSILFRDQLVTGYMSEPGDSGSPVFLEDGELVGLLFAGSAEQTICNRIATVEAELGVEVLAAEPDDGTSDERGSGERRGDESADVPVYATAMDHTVSVDLEAPEPTLESLEFADEIRRARPSR